MATCKKCIHQNKCFQNGKTRYYGEKIAADNVEQLCEWFISTADVAPKSEVAREIFAEIEKDGKYAISFVENHKSYSEEVRQSKLECYKDIQNYIAELKKKYMEGRP